MSRQLRTSQLSMLYRVTAYAHSGSIAPPEFCLVASEAIARSGCKTE